MFSDPHKHYYKDVYVDTSLCRGVFRVVCSRYVLSLLTGRMCRQLMLFPPKLSFIFRPQLLNTVEVQREISTNDRCSSSMKYDVYDVLNLTLYIAA